MSARWLKGLILVFLGVVIVSGCRFGPSEEEKARQRAEEAARQWAEIKALKDQDFDTYYDRLVAFLQEHPDHQEAIAAYVEASMPGIHSYILRGQYNRAARELLGIKQVAKNDTRLDAWIEEIQDMATVSRAQFDQIENGMSYDDVIAIMGYPPVPYGMRAEEMERLGRKFYVVSFFYKNEDGGIAAVYFRDGEVYSKQYRTGEEKQPGTQAPSQ